MPARDDIIRAAFAQRDALLAVAFALTRDWGLAEDAVQEAFVLVVQRWEDVTEVEGVLPWAKQIVRFKSFEALRERRRAPDPAGDHLPLMLAQAVDERLDEGGSDRFNEMRRALLSCMGELSDEHRALMHGYYWEHLSTDQLAARHARTGTGVRTLLQRLRQRLDRCMRIRLQEASA